MSIETHIEKGEALQIAISVLAISIAFSIAYVGIGALFSYTKYFLIFCFISLVGVGSGFILHEMAHKIVAIHYGAYARFNMWLNGLVFMFITSIFGFLFAAPGAVYIYSRTITKKENGVISLVGPITNIVIALIFIFLIFFKPLHIQFPFDIPFSVNGYLNVWYLGAQMNVILALFNMIPAFPLDGSKVFMWSKIAWLAVVLFCMLIGVKLFSMGLVISWLILMIIAIFFSKIFFR